MTTSFPNESAEYREARNALLAAEIDLRQKLEDVAAQRRALPPGGELPQDFEFTGLDGTPAPLSTLFGAHDTLALYSFMFSPGDARPCPACTSLMDGLAAQAPQVAQRIALAAVSAAPPDALAELVADRGWTNVPFYSAQGTDYQRLYFGEDTAGRTRTFMNVFERSGTQIRHFWGSELERADIEGHPRHIDLIWPIWGLLDMTRMGRGDWFPKIFV